MSYGAMLAIATLAGGALALRAAKKERLDIGLMYVVLAVTVLGAFVGGYLLYIVVEWLRTGDLMQGVLTFGRVLLGSMVGGFLAFYWIAGRFGMPRARMMDFAVPAIAAAHAIGRVGCFLGGCCFGSESHLPWAVTATDPLAPASYPSIPRHPTALYEALAVLAIASLSGLLTRKKKYDGERFALYAMMYAVARFSLEFLRGDTIRGLAFNVVSTSQLVALALFALALYLHRQSLQPHPPRRVG